MIGAIVGQQVTSFRRQRVTSTFLGTVAATGVLAGVIGWMSRQTIVRVYDESVRLLAERGATAPPNPFLAKPPLALLSNMSIYVTLIGALLAIVVGHLAVVGDQSNGIGRLLFSRQLPRSAYAAGKLISCAAITGMAAALIAILGYVSLTLVNRALPSGAEVLRLIGFSVISWVYLLFFCIVGMVGVLATRHRPLALLGAMGIWLVFTFAVPQFTSGLRPTTSLNPITDPVSTSQPFFSVTARARPLSISEQYKEASGHLLETATPEAGTATALRVLPLVVGVLALSAMFGWLVERHDYSMGALDE